MRTDTFIERWRSFRKWLKYQWISHKQVLESHEAALYLRTTLYTIYELAGDYSVVRSQ